MKLRLSNTTIFYPELRYPVLLIGSLTFETGINFLVGENGSGKSTLLKALSDFDQEVIMKGNIDLEGKPLKNFNVGLVKQNPLQSINTELTFLENLSLASTTGYEHISLKRQITPENFLTIMKFIETFRNSDMLMRLFHLQAKNLSSGQQQMLAILMRVIRFQGVLLLDECTANLDFLNTKSIIGILLELIEKGTIIIFATHQLELLKTSNSKIYKVENGTVKNSYQDISQEEKDHIK